MHEGYVNNVLSAISVNDIEKVTVLKNATALYGAKGANGVVVIETKRAKSMATRIDVDIYGAMELMPKLPTMMNADQYRLYASDVMGNVTTTPDFLDDYTQYGLERLCVQGSFYTKLWSECPGRGRCGKL